MIKDDSNIDKYQVTGWGLWRDDLKPIILQKISMQIND